jgi:hypothetical protein
VSLYFKGSLPKASVIVGRQFWFNGFERKDWVFSGSRGPKCMPSLDKFSPESGFWRSNVPRWRESRGLWRAVLVPECTSGASSGGYSANPSAHGPRTRTRWKHLFLARRSDSFMRFLKLCRDSLANGHATDVGSVKPKLVGNASEKRRRRHRHLLSHEHQQLPVAFI